MSLSLNMSNSNMGLATDMIGSIENHKEIGIGGTDQDQSPANSEPPYPPNICSIDGCDNSVKFIGLCMKHYNQKQNMIKNERANKICDCGCGQPISYRSTYARGHNVRITKHLGSSGKENNMWKGGRHEQKGYVFIYSPSHIFANNNGYVREHLLVMEKLIGRPIDTNVEVVHHINFIKNDNREDNLFLCDKKTHSFTHTSIYPLVKELLDREIIEFDRETGKYIMKVKA